VTPDDFRRLALVLDGAEEGEHMGQSDFRVDGRIFATLAHAADGYGNLLLTAEEQEVLVDELPDVFKPISGGWGRMGGTHVVLANVTEEVLAGALHAAWRIRVAKNRKAKKRPAARTKSKPKPKPKAKPRRVRRRD
jgi:hypothetical protein